MSEDTEEAEGTDGEVILIGILALLAGWGFLYPRPNWLCINCLAFAPWVAMAMLGFPGRRMRLLALLQDGKSTSSVAPAMVAPAVLGLRALMDVDVVDHLPALAGAAIVAIAFVAAFLRASPRADVESTWRLHPLRLSAYLGLVARSYGWGLIVETNAMYDQAAPTATPMRVRDKYRGNLYRTWGNLALVPVTGNGDEVQVSVSQQLYGSTRIGQILCIFRYPGRFGIGWREAGPCPAGSRP